MAEGKVQKIKSASKSQHQQPTFIRAGNQWASKEECYRCQTIDLITITGTEINTHFFFLLEITSLSENSVHTKNMLQIKKTIIWPKCEYSMGV